MTIEGKTKSRNGKDKHCHQAKKVEIVWTRNQKELNQVRKNGQ